VIVPTRAAARSRRDRGPQGAADHPTQACKAGDGIHPPPALSAPNPLVSPTGCLPPPPLRALGGRAPMSQPGGWTVDQELMLQLDMLGVVPGDEPAEQSVQLQLDSANPARSAPLARLQLERLQLESL